MIEEGKILQPRRNAMQVAVEYLVHGYKIMIRQLIKEERMASKDWSIVPKKGVDHGNMGEYYKCSRIITRQGIII